VGEVEMTVRVCDAEYHTVVGFVASPLIQWHEVMCCPSSLVSPPVLINHIQVLAALRATAVLPDKSCILCAVLEPHFSTLELRFEGR